MSAEKFSSFSVAPFVWSKATKRTELPALMSLIQKDAVYVVVEFLGELSLDSANFLCRVRDHLRPPTVVGACR